MFGGGGEGVWEGRSKTFQGEHIACSMTRDRPVCLGNGTAQTVGGCVMNG